MSESISWQGQCYLCHQWIDERYGNLVLTLRFENGSYVMEHQARCKNAVICQENKKHLHK